MRKILLACDLDNTLIHSHRHKREGDICVELLRGAEQGFMCRRAYDSLLNLSERVELLPITTRSVEQFERIKLPEGCYNRAVTTNGAILIEKGRQNEEWRERNLSYASELMPLMRELLSELEGDSRLNVARIVDEVYLYISCKDSTYVGDYMDSYSSIKDLDIMASGRKIFFLPPKINKGIALSEIVKGGDYSLVAAAGDSSIDLSMLEVADHAIIPKALAPMLKNPNRSVHTGDGDFAEFVIETLERLLQ